MGCSGSKINAVTGNDRLREAEEILSHFDALQQLAPELRSTINGLHPNLTQLELKISLSSNPNLLRYIHAYITNAAATIKFLTNIQQCLDAARKTSSSLHDAVRFFFNKDYIQSLSMMKDFTDVGSPFSALNLLEGQHNSSVGTVSEWRKRLERKLSMVKVSRKVWKAACNAALVLALASAVVLAALGMPPVATTSAFVGSTGIKTAEQWLDAILKGREDDLKGEREVVRAMGALWFVVHELDTIRVLVGNMEIEYGSLANEVEIVVFEEDEMAVMDAVEGIRDGLMVLEDKMNGLGREVARCIDEIKSAVANFFKLVIEG